MALVACPVCSGAGSHTIPRPEISAKGEPMIILHIETCETCRGSGTVDDGS